MNAQYLILLIILQTTTSKRFRIKGAKDIGSSENVVVYKDCRHKNGNNPIKLDNPIYRSPVQPTPSPAQSACPCPRMCCTMCCDCNDQPQTSYMSRSMTPIQQPMKPMMSQTPGRAPAPGPPRILRKKMLRGPQRLPLKGSARRNLGATREHIKGLISQDEDIKKILKDLVRVTIMKVNQIDIPLEKDTKNTIEDEKIDNTIQESDESQ